MSSIKTLHYFQKEKYITNTILHQESNNYITTLYIPVTEVRCAWKKFPRNA